MAGAPRSKSEWRLQRRQTEQPNIGWRERPNQKRMAITTAATDQPNDDGKRMESELQTAIKTYLSEEGLTCQRSQCKDKNIDEVTIIYGKHNIAATRESLWCMHYLPSVIRR